MKKKKKQRKISGVCSIIMTPKNVPLSSSTNSSTPYPPPQQKHNYSNKCFPLNVQPIKKKKLCFTKLTSVQGGYDGIGWWFQGRYEDYEEEEDEDDMTRLLSLHCFSCCCPSSLVLLFSRQVSFFVNCAIVLVWHVYIKVAWLMAYYKIGFLWGKYSVVDAVVVVPSSQSFFSLFNTIIVIIMIIGKSHLLW